MTTRIRDNARILRCAAISALADLRATYTWKTWTFAWLLRILTQVTLFAFIGKLIGSPATLAYLVIGNSVFVTADIVMLVTASTTWERMDGTLTLLVCAPASSFVVFAGRSIQWLLDGLACSTVSLLLLTRLLGVHLPPLNSVLALPVVAITGASVYCFGLVLGGLALRAMSARNIIGRLGSILLMVVTGVQVPTSFWPAPVQAVAQLLPLTHGLRAVRELLAGARPGPIIGNLALEIAVGTGWALVAVLTYWRFVVHGRQTGSLEFG
jgi:ABC-2 type transport system permease protein